MVTSSLERESWSIPNLRFSPTLPDMFSAFFTIPSRFLNSVSHLTAVFGPTFSTPGTLSEVSPINAR